MAMVIVWLAEAAPWLPTPLCSAQALVTGGAGRGAAGRCFRGQDIRIEADACTSQEEYRPVTFTCKM
jgi:hypothetical protein